MIQGRFGENTGSPYVEAVVRLPRLNTAAKIQFLVDTGSDSTALMPSDGFDRLHLDYQELKGDRLSFGFGGRTQEFVEDAVITFTEPGRYFYVYRQPILIARSNDDLLGIPSILGRDILNRWEMRYAPAARRPNLRFKVVSADATVPISGP